MNVFFDVQEMYYLPQYTPIKASLEAQGIQVTFVIYRKGGAESRQEVLLDKACDGACVQWVDNEAAASALYLKQKPDWLIIANTFHNLDEIHKNTKTALVSHGIGPKACYYQVSDSATSVRFVEGPYRTQRLKEMYPEQHFVDTGYAKLDPIANGELDELKPSNWGLDDSKKTILYAPTFYPSSIECLPIHFPKEFAEYNVILKPHYFSLANGNYKKQKRLLEIWGKSENVYLAGLDEVNIIPFMAVADVLISDASSTLFEFAALNKPVVWCDFYKLRWGYRGLLKFRFKKRMDKDLYKYAGIAIHAKTYQELKACVDSQIQNPAAFSQQRQHCTLALAGKVDGQSSQRIVDYILSNNN
ncbi:MAG: CDP-glycerol glycerophosphotransferase family protein [Bermanella sp.]